VTPEQFCYWLQGRAEMQPDNPPSAEEWKIISDHLKLVFKKETPTRVPAPGPAEVKRAQDEIKRAKDEIKKLPDCWPPIQPSPFLGEPYVKPLEVIC